MVAVLWVSQSSRETAGDRNSSVLSVEPADSFGVVFAPGLQQEQPYLILSFSGFCKLLFGWEARGFHCKTTIVWIPF